jgi:hypothetical protein
VQNEKEKKKVRDEKETKTFSQNTGISISYPSAGIKR